MMKAVLKECHATNSRNVPNKIASLKDRLLVLYCEGEEEGLTDEDVVELLGVTSNICSLSRMHTIIQWQQSRLL
jgi:hypothetical protein